MALPLNDEWRIASNGLDWVLQKRAVSESGKENWQSKGFYPTIGYACKAFVKKNLLAADESWLKIAETAEQVINDVQRMCESVDKLSTKKVDTVDKPELFFLD